MSLDRYRRIIREEMRRRPGREVGGKTLSQAIAERERQFHLSTFWDALSAEEAQGTLVVTRGNGERRVTIRWVEPDKVPALRAAAPDRTIDDVIDTIEADAYALARPSSLEDVRMTKRATTEVLDAYDALGAQIAILLRQGMGPLVEQQARERSAALQAEVNEMRARIQACEARTKQEAAAREEAEQLARIAMDDLERERRAAADLRAQMDAMKPLLDAFRAIGAMKP